MWRWRLAPHLGYVLGRLLTTIDTAQLLLERFATRGISRPAQLFHEQHHEKSRTQSRICLGSLLRRDGLPRYRGKSHASVLDYHPGGSWREGGADG